MKWRVPLADLDYGLEEETAVHAVLARRWLTMGEETQQLEAEFAAFTGAEHAIAVTNCTAALHLAALALDLGPGDEVILPALTFVATANGMHYTGAEPVFADIGGEDDLNIAVDDIEARITERTRAVVVVHYGGYPADMPAILRLARKHNLYVIEDAAHAPGSRLNGRHLGTWGDIGCFSFFSNKNLATGEGGMLVTDDATLADKMRLMRSHGMTTLTWDRHRGHAFRYDVVAPGYNYRIDEIRAALGRVQLGKLEAGNRRRQELNTLYENLLSDLAPSLVLPFQKRQGDLAYHLRPVLLPVGADRQLFMTAMKEAGIQTSIHYPLIHQFEYYRGLDRNATLTLPVSETVASREVTLPLYANLKGNQVELVCQTVPLALKAAVAPI